MTEDQRLLLLSSSSRFQPPQGVKISYGTAGFREDASILQSTDYRVGILAALRAVKTQSVIGLMITASHNKVYDNGIKVADPSGGMLSQDWEPFADTLANPVIHSNLLRSVFDIITTLITEFVENEKIKLDGAKLVEMLLARDTRPSGESLLEVAREGISSIIGAVALDMGVLTTPTLHWVVRARNNGVKASEMDYFEQLSSSFRCLVNLIPKGADSRIEADKVVLDGANGVGGEKLEFLKKMLDSLVIEVRNSGKGGVLNEGVDADYVQKENVAPSSFGSQDV